MKKETSNKILLSFILTGFLISMLSIGVIAPDSVGDQLSDAQTREAGRTIGTVLVSPFLGFAEGVLQAIFGSEWAVGTRIFFFILLWLIIGSILPLVLPTLGSSNSKFLQWMISFVIAVLSVISIPPEMIDNLLAAYGAMGATLLTIIPFAIILVFSITTKNALIARATWIFFSVYFIGLYLYRIVSATGTAELIYAYASILGFIMILIIGGVRRYWYKIGDDAKLEVGQEQNKKAKVGRSIYTHAADTLGNE